MLEHTSQCAYTALIKEANGNVDSLKPRKITCHFALGTAECSKTVWVRPLTTSPDDAGKQVVSKGAGICIAELDGCGLLSPGMQEIVNDLNAIME